MSNADEQAFPIDTAMYRSLGLTKREHAAILLRVPKSGDDDIDAMIREANRRDATAPELLEMVGLLIKAADESETCVDFSLRCDKFIGQARSVYAKATGATHD